MTDSAIKINELTYCYPESTKPALSGIDLDIPKGQFIVIMGMNGSGKSTLTLCLNGIIPQILEGQIQGRVQVMGKDTGKIQAPFLAKTVGLVLQDPESQIIGITVEEDTAFGPRNLGLPDQEIKSRVRAELARVKLTGFESRKTDELSGGEKQRLVLAGVLAMHQEILILDEPASELDPEGRDELYAVLDELRKEQAKTIIVVEHSIEDVLNRADLVIVLQDGVIAWQGEPRTLFRDLRLLNQFGIRPLAVSEYFWSYVQSGQIKIEDIPLSVDEAIDLVQRVLPRKHYSQRDDITSQHNLHPEMCTNFQSTDKSTDKWTDKSPVKGTVVVRGLTHQYSSSGFSLDNINLEIKSGEYITLIGPNGAGKTTLTKHLNGLLKPLQGEIRVSGINTKERHVSQLARTVGYVFQNPDHQLFETTIEKELAFGLKKCGMTENLVKNRVEEVIHDFGLDDYRGRHPLTLGKSEKQLLAMATSIILGPDILVIDEPTKGLDWRGARKVMKMIKDLHRQGITIIAITHDMELAAVSERVIVLNAGKIVKAGPPQEVFQDKETLAAARIIPPSTIIFGQILKAEDNMSPK